jgi:ABC-type nitrate/sulfonate/bicarbonate transport system substrate-binding protein
MTTYLNKDGEIVEGIPDDNSSKILKTYDNGMPHIIDDELNYRTGVPHWGCIVSELDNYAEVMKANGIDPDDDPTGISIPFSLLVSAVEEYGKALEQAVEELYDHCCFRKACHHCITELKED